MFLRHNPVCLKCERRAEEVDHIIPLARGGTNKWENLQSLCKSCHSKKTIRENRGESGRIQPKNTDSGQGRGMQISSAPPFGTGEGSQIFTLSSFEVGGVKPMGNRGPTPKPTKLKVIQGTYRKDRASTNEPKPEQTVPKCPTFLKGEARREWRRITAELIKLKLLSEIDRAALAAYCTNWEMYVEADKIIRKEGMTCITPKGHVQQRAEIGIRNRAMLQMKAFLSEFGMTPASRTRISVPEERINPDNPFAKLESGT